MGFTITLTVIGFIIFFLVLLKDICKNDDLCMENILLTLVGSALCAAASSLIGLIFSAIFTVIASHTVATESYVEEYPIYALSATDSTYLCRSRVSSLTDAYYEYKCIVSDEKGKHFTSITSNDVYVFETTDTPTLKVHRQKYKDAWYMRIIEPIINDDWVDYYEFYVPEGTVTYNYNLDLQ